MSITDKTISRLEELLELKDQELERVDAERAELQRQLDYGIDWMLHKNSSLDSETLPVPRIEMKLKSVTDHHLESEVVMVLAHRWQAVSRIPVGYSKSSGSRLKVEVFPTTGILSVELANQLPGLLNDACFYAEKTGIPAYVVVDETRHYKVTSLRPLQLTAVE